MKNEDLILKNARVLRKNMTKQERKLWSILKNKQFFDLKFRRQVPIGQYIVDFVCEKYNLIIELDGGQHNESINIKNDDRRTAFLMEHGYQVLRFWNYEIDNDIDSVCEVIYKSIFE